MDQATAFVVDALTVVILHKIHLVHETEDESGRAKFFQGFDDCTVGVKVAFDFARFNVEDVDENCNVGKDGLALGSEVRLCEGILSGVMSAFRAICSVDMLARRNPRG